MCCTSDPSANSIQGHTEVDPLYDVLRRRNIGISVLVRIYIFGGVVLSPLTLPPCISVTGGYGVVASAGVSTRPSSQRPMIF